MTRFLREREPARAAGAVERVLIWLFLAGVLVLPAAVAVGIIVSGEYWSE